MPKNDIKFNIGIGTTADTKGIQEIQRQLEKLREQAKLDMSIDPEVLRDIGAVQTALTGAFDTKLNTVNIEKFNNLLKTSNTSIHQVGISLSKMGVEGQKTFLNLTSEALKVGQAVKQTNKFIDSMAITLKNSVKWSFSSSIIKNFTLS